MRQRRRCRAMRPSPRPFCQKISYPLRVRYMTPRTSCEIAPSFEDTGGKASPQQDCTCDGADACCARYAEDALEAAVSQGIRQYVLIGAGFDSFALRRPAFSADLQIFEIDFPATQTFKIQRISECGISLPDSVHFIAADLSRESVAAALARSSFERDRLTFFSWLGVTMYLTREANLAPMRSIASCAPMDIELAFTYFDARLFQVQSES